MPKITRLAFIGFGHTAESMLNLGLNRPDRVITAFDPRALEAETCKGQLERFIVCGVQGCFSIQDAVNSAHLVVLSDSESDLKPWMRELEKHLQPGQIVADLRTASDIAKSQLRNEVENMRGIYIDGELRSQNDLLTLHSQEIAKLKDIFKSLEFFPNNMTYSESV